MNKMELIDFSVGYSVAKPLCGIVNLEATSNGPIALMGANGIGKSTLLKSIAGLCRPLHGRVEVNGAHGSVVQVGGTQERLTHKHGRLSDLVAYVPAKMLTATSFSVFDSVATGLYRSTNWVGHIGAMENDKVLAALRRCGVEQLADRDIDTLSDGELQRVSVARTLVRETPVLLLDEPMAFLDVKNRYAMAQLLNTLCNDEQKVVIYSSHDVELSLEFCSRIWVMTKVGIVEHESKSLTRQTLLQLLFE